MKVMLVDDEKSNLDIMKFLMESEGIKTLCVDDALLAFEKWRENRTDVCAVVSDLHAPRMFSGMDFLKKLREVDKELPFFLTSGDINVSFESLKELAPGLSGFFAKPVNPKILMSIVAEACYCRSFQGEAV